MKVLIVAGHGQGDSGACACGYKEADLTREVASLLSQYGGVTVYDMSKDLYKQQAAGKRFDFTPYDYVLELHFNAGGGTGTEILVRSGTTESTSTAQNILNSIIPLGFRNRGVKGRLDLYNMNVCSAQGVPYALLEVCFIDNKDDVNLYQTKKNEIVSAIAKGLNIKKDGELTMTQYDELLELIQNQQPVIYNYIDVNMPDWAKPTIQKLCDKGILQGNEEGLGLTMDMLRILVMLDRQGVFN